MTSSETRAPEWDQGMGLAWSGKWHVITGSNPAHRYEETKCGAYVERFESKYFPNHLWAIAEGKKSAPVCKKCVPPDNVDEIHKLAQVLCESVPVLVSFSWEEAVYTARAVIAAGWVKR